MRIEGLMLVAVLAACSPQPEPPPDQKQQKGRAETQNIRNTDAIGYSGGEIADKVDAALDANDERNKQLEEAESQ